MAKAKNVLLAALLTTLTDTAKTFSGADKTRLNAVLTFAKETKPLDDEGIKALRPEVIKAMQDGGTPESNAKVYATQITSVLRHYWADTKINGKSFREMAEGANDIRKVYAALPKKASNGGRPAGSEKQEETALARFLKGVMEAKIDQNAEGFQWAALNVAKTMELLAAAYNAEKTAAEQAAAEAMERQKTAGLQQQAA